VKRSGSHSWEGEAHKTSKQQHIVETSKPPAQTIPSQPNIRVNASANVDLWPPFSVSLTTIQTTHTTAQVAHVTPSNIFPTVYYIPQNVSSQEQRGHLQALPYMPGVIYQPMVYSHPFYQMQFQPTTSQSNINDSIYNSAFQFDRNIAVPISQQKIPTPIGSGSQFDSTTVFQSPPSQATSVKADMGSTSASVVNRVWIEIQRQKLFAPFFHLH
jgi:period circadian protein 2